MDGRQTKLFGMLRDIVGVFERNGIRFYAFYGTMLGAVRHGGFIPWDDDVDLAVFREDLPRISQVLSAELDPERYYYHVPSADSHPHVIYKEGDFEESLSRKEAPVIDLFVLSRYPSGKVGSFFAKTFIALSVMSSVAVDKVNNQAIHGFLAKMPLWFQRVAASTGKEGSGLRAIYVDLICRSIYPEECFGEPAVLKFEDLMLPLPNEYDRLLRMEYGDYMIPPPEGNRSGATGYPLSVIQDYRGSKR